MKDSLVFTVAKLAQSLNDEEGVSEETYNSIRNLVFIVMGEKCVQYFSNRVNATDGRFYLKERDDNLTSNLIVICFSSMLP